MRKILILLAGISALALNGCALSPQKLEPSPKLLSQLSPTGYGQVVSLQVIDGRPSTLLGSRGGLYPETSTIVVRSPDVMPKILNQAEAGTRLLGYTPSQNAQGAPSVTLTLVKLEYQSPKDRLYVTEATIRAAFKMNVVNGPKQYTGTYQASLKQQFGMAPNESTNSKLVSEVLSDALTRAFKDPRLGQFLSN